VLREKTNEMKSGRPIWKSRKKRESNVSYVLPFSQIRQRERRREGRDSAVALTSPIRREQGNSGHKKTMEVLRQDSKKMIHERNRDGKAHLTPLSQGLGEEEVKMRMQRNVLHRFRRWKEV